MKVIPAIISSFFWACFISACSNNTKDKQAITDSGQTVVLTPYIKNLKSMIATHPDSVGVRLKLIDAYDSLNLFIPAILEIDSLITKDKFNYGLWYRKGRLSENAEDTAAAIDAYQHAIAIYPAPDALLSLASLYAEQKNKTALDLCNQVAELRLGRETNANCSFITGVYYARTGQTNKAIQAFDQSINQNFTLMEAYMEKGFIYYDKKVYTKALQIFQMAAQVNNTYADAYYWQAKCYEALQNTNDAIKNYQTSLTLDPTLHEAVNAIKRLVHP
ncbi:tetratricopeptide repeat protein [Hydrotalea sp.]|uniref:tetratricopeptide repeat protein n=1 Tax=Hydrotalea sp. TaxID=2881279 RepID=UPI00263797ED|nr:tetratricopeptide repeat protein [Hydrotalea sp.]